MRIRMSRQNKFTGGWAALILYALITLIITLTVVRNVYQEIAMIFACLLMFFTAVLYQGFEVIKE